MADQKDIKQRQVHMNARKRPGNPSRSHGRSHPQLLAMWRAAQRAYAKGTDARDIRMQMPERRHESKKQEEGEL